MADDRDQLFIEQTQQGGARLERRFDPQGGTASLGYRGARGQRLAKDSPAPKRENRKTPREPRTSRCTTSSVRVHDAGDSPARYRVIKVSAGHVALT